MTGFEEAASAFLGKVKSAGCALSTAAGVDHVLTHKAELPEARSGSSSMDSASVDPYDIRKSIEDFSQFLDKAFFKSWSK